MTARDQALALAGVFQASVLARSIASQGGTDEGPLTTTIGSLYQFEPSDVDSIYGGPGRLRLGLETLTSALAGHGDREVLRYAFGLLQLERKLVRRGDLLSHIREGIQDCQRQADHLGPTHDAVLSQLGEIYLRTVSTLGPRLVVRGQPLYLQQPRLVASIRAILLAGIRSAVLWTQVGGSRLRLLFTRGRLIREANRMLDEISA